MDVRALFVDAAGTLLRPREPVGMTYARHARALGHAADPFEVEARFRAALRAPRDGGQLGDGRRYWARVVQESVGVEDPALFDRLYAWYAEPRAWWIDREALLELGAVARQGVRLGIVSNWDLRLRTLYERMALERLFPVLICSAEIGVEKPDPAIFRAACHAAGVRPCQAVHLGDDPVKDVEGAARAGLAALQYDAEEGFGGLAEKIGRLRRYF